MIVEKIPVEQLRRAAYNPRKDLTPADAEYQDIRKSIETFGYVDPVVFNRRSGNIVGGDQRVKVLKELGCTEIDCVVVDLPGAEERALNIALNKVSGTWDAPKLESLLRELEAELFDVSATGFAEAELAALFRGADLAAVADDGFDEPLPETPITQLGDIWQLGQHRLICGDATRVEDYTALMSGEQAELIVTDPPYNVDYDGKAGKILNDRLTDAQFYDFLASASAAMYGVCDDGAAFYMFYAGREAVNFRTALTAAGFLIHQTCIWVKNSAVMGRCDYHNDHEPVLYGWKPTAAHRWFADRKQRTVWHFDRPTVSKYHPTMKPVDLIAYPIANNSAPGAVVLDPFGGSGSTLIACQQLGRRCRMMEIDERYADVIVRRYVSFAGSDGVELIRDGEQVPWADITGGNLGKTK